MRFELTAPSTARRRRWTYLTQAAAEMAGDDLLRLRLADSYRVERIELVATRRQR